jgi:ankyrin repeat protein
MEAAREGHDEVVDLLVQEGADVNHKSYANSLQLSPLHMAAASGNLRSLDLLVAAGANLNAVGSKNDSALFWSLSEGKPEAALKLINLGADPYIQSDYGMSAADIILQGNNETLKSALPTAKAIGP